MILARCDNVTTGAALHIFKWRAPACHRTADHSINRRFFFYLQSHFIVVAVVFATHRFHRSARNPARTAIASGYPARFIVWRARISERKKMKPVNSLRLKSSAAARSLPLLGPIDTIYYLNKKAHVVEIIQSGTENRWGRQPLRTRGDRRIDHLVDGFLHFTRIETWLGTSLFPLSLSLSLSPDEKGGKKCVLGSFACYCGRHCIS